MNYQKIYDDLIERARTRVLLGYKENHHIIPRCMGGDDSKSNRVDLTAEEHFLAHQLLIKINPTHRGLASAVLFMTSNGFVDNSKQYGWLRRHLSELTSGENHIFKTNKKAHDANQSYMRSERNPQKRNPRSGERHHFFGKKNPFEWSEESRKKVSEGKTGDKNPMFQIPPWKNPACKGLALDIWRRAEDVLELHLENPTWGYSKIAKAMQLDVVHRAGGVLAKLQSGWRPQDDQDWINTFKTIQHDTSIQHKQNR